jgi:hypothetical protein
VFNARDVLVRLPPLTNTRLAPMVLFEHTLPQIVKGDRMAKKVRAFTGDRTDPKQNKSLAIRTVLETMPASKANEVAAEVKKQFGHAVSVNQIYMIKAKAGMAKRPKRSRKAGSPSGNGRLSSAALWVDAIKIAKQLLAATGSVDNATALLKAIAG